MQQSHKEPVSGGPTVLQAKWLCAATLALGIAILPCQEASAATVSPTSITFQAVQGGASPSSQTISVDKELTVQLPGQRPIAPRGSHFLRAQGL